MQHKSESWFVDDVEKVDQYLRSNVEKFWKVIENGNSKIQTISGYTTTRNCIDQKYPFIESIKSMLGFCDQVVVADSGSTDGTWELLLELSKEDDRVIVERKERDYNHPRFGVYSGLEKAYARSFCTGDWCWQQDSDEVVHEDDYEKIKRLIYLKLIYQV